MTHYLPITTEFYNEVIKGRMYINMYHLPPNMSISDRVVFLELVNDREAIARTACMSVIDIVECNLMYGNKMYYRIVLSNELYKKRG